MTPAFKVGEIAIMCNAELDIKANGMECTILATGNTCWSAVNGAVYSGYKVRGADGNLRNVAPHQLRKKRPPATDESTARQAMLDCIERARLPQGVPA